MRRLRVLGPLEVDDADQALGPRDRVVVSALALRPGERVDAEVLAEALWGEQLPASWTKVVQGCVSRLRRALGTEVIETVDGGYRLAPDRLELDRQRFEELVARAQEHLAHRSPERAVPLLREALGLWRGPAYTSLEEWLPGRLEAARLGQLRLTAEEDLLQARLDAGDHLGVAADGTVLTGQQPFRERRWALLALAQYRCGRQADALASIRAARRALGQELGLDPGSELVTLERRILAQDPGLAADHQARIADQGCPWKGLEPYREGDGDAFYGRDAEVEACLTRLEETPVLVVSGPSGSGKSSLVRAGLVPRLRRAGRSVEVFTPGPDGAAAMAAARQRSPGTPVLVVDQLEETFTLGEAGYARPWLRLLARYAEESAPVVVAVRGDHLAALAADPDLARLAERGLHLVAPLDGEAVRQVVEEPARAAGLRLEPGLVDLLVRDAEGQPGALPLLSHALAETWRRREGTLLTVDGYRAAGGIRDAVAASAERLYDGVTPEEQAEVRWLMLRLVSLSDGGEPFRTPLGAGVVAGLGDARRRVLDLLVRGRLVTSHTHGYDLAHEALVRAWPRLRGWLDEDREGQQIRRHLAVAAAGWEALDRPDSELYRGARLTAALDWLERGQEPLAESERAFVEASREAADAHVRRLAEESGRQRAQNRRLRGLVAAAVVLLVVAGVAWQVALDRGQAAARDRDAATDAARAAAHESMVARSLGLRASDRAIAALLAVRAWQVQPDALAESALLGSVPASSGLLGYRTLTLGGYRAAAEVPGQDRLLVASGTSVGLLDPVSGRLSGPVRRYASAVDVPSVLRVSADGTRAVQLLTNSTSTVCPPSCPQVFVYDLDPLRARPQAIDVGFAATDLAVSPDGSLVTAVGGGGRTDAATWDVATGRLVARGRLGATAATYSTPDRVLLGSSASRLREVGARTLDPVRSIAVPAGSADIRVVVAGGTVVAAGARGLVALDRASGRRTWTTAGDPSAQPCLLLTVSAPSGRVLCGTSSLVEERDLASGRRVRTLDPQLGRLGAIAVHRGPGGGEQLLQFHHVGERYATWNLDGPGLGARLLVPGAAATGGYDPGGRWWLATTGDGTTAVHDPEGSRVLALPPGRAAWVSADTVAVLGRRSVLVRVPSGRVRPLPVRDAVAVFPGAGSRAWAVSRRRDATLVTGFEVGGPADGPVIELPLVEDPRVVADDRRVLVTYRTTGLQGFLREFETHEYDAVTGAHVTRGLPRTSSVLLAPGSLIVTGDDDGGIAARPEVFGGAARELTRVPSAVVGLQLSRDRTRVLAVSADHDLHLVDWASGARLGDPIPTQPPGGVPGGWLRPDGRALLTNTAAGVVVWDLSPGAMASTLCALAGRNPEYGEWETFFGDRASYIAPVCRGYPTAADQVPTDQ